MVSEKTIGFILSRTKVIETFRQEIEVKSFPLAVLGFVSTLRIICTYFDLNQPFSIKFNFTHTQIKSTKDYEK